MAFRSYPSATRVLKPAAHVKPSALESRISVTMRPLMSTNPYLAQAIEKLTRMKRMDLFPLLLDIRYPALQRFVWRVVLDS